MTSIEDVARKAGVSVATVSRALRGQPGVAGRTRERVQDVAVELGYTISRSASGLATGRTSRIGVVCPHVGRWYHGQVIDAAEEVIRAAGFDLLLYATKDADARERFFADLPLRRNVDAVLVLSLPLTEPEAEALRELKVPLGIVGLEVPGFSSVRIDDYQGATKAMRHLVNLGHRDIALLCGVGLMWVPTSRDRRAAYLDVLSSLGVEPRAGLQASERMTIAGGERAMAQVLAAEVLPTAVFAHCDEMAMGALRTVRKHGLSIPDDLSIVGFDGHELAEFLDLTTIAQPVRDEGAIAAKMLLEQLESGSAETRDIVLPTELVVRGSTIAKRSRAH